MDYGIMFYALGKSIDRRIEGNSFIISFKDAQFC